MNRAVLTAAVLVAMLFTFGCKSSDTGSATRTESQPEIDGVEKTATASDVQTPWDAPAGVIDFKNTSMEAALDHLKSLAPIGKMDVRWESLEAVGIERSTPVTLQLSISMPISKAVALLMRQFESINPEDPIASRIVGGVMVIAPESELVAATAANLHAVTQAEWSAPADTIAFNNTSMEAALGHLQSLTPYAKMDVRWESLKAIGIERDTQVTLQLESGVPASTVLALLLRQFEQLDPYNPPASRIIDGAMVVGSREDVGL